MTAREVIAYAITHAPPGVKGGPYEGCGAIGGATAHLGCALRWPDAGGRMWAREALASVRRSVPHARVIRIVRVRPSEASAVEVLRELVAWDDWAAGPAAEYDTILARARRVLAASGPDPMPVVRAALRFAEHCTPALEGSAWFEATHEFIDAVDTYRKAGGTP